VSEADAQIVFVAGLSGSGKSTAMAALEDLSFYCVDNLPTQLVVQFLDLCAKATPPIDKVALAVDAREERFLRHFPELVPELRQAGAAVQVLFLDCTDEVLQNRYRETRRVHPLAPAGTVEAGIQRERGLLAEIAELADYTIDTAGLNVHQLKETVIERVCARARKTVVSLLSFGFRYGPPAAAELLFDVRFLPNPYFEPRLRLRSGVDPEVAHFVLDSPRGKELLERLMGFLRFLLPLYDQEGKAYVTIGTGCTGGRHRSVAIATAIAESLRGDGREVNLEHRDVERDS